MYFGNCEINGAFNKYTAVVRSDNDFMSVGFYLNGEPLKEVEKSDINDKNIFIKRLRKIANSFTHKSVNQQLINEIADSFCEELFLFYETIYDTEEKIKSFELE